MKSVGGKTPPMLSIQPKLLAVAQPFFQAFLRLQGSRLSEAGSVPMSEIAAYFEVYSITNLDMREKYVKFITVCDKKYLEVQEVKNGPRNKFKAGGGLTARPNRRQKS